MQSGEKKSMGKAKPSRRNRPVTGPRGAMLRRPRGLNDALALPGEVHPLEHEDGRGPITDEEALGVARRRRRLELAEAPKRADATRRPVPDELPSVTAKKEPVMIRLPPRITLFARARAEVEGTNLSAVFEEFLINYAQGKPSKPATVTKRLKNVFNRVYKFDT